MDREARQARARRREVTWSGRLLGPGDEDLPPEAGTIQDRLILLAELSQRAWALTGQAFPVWSRAEMPGRVLRKGS